MLIPRHVYRFTPLVYGKDWMARVHEIDERIAIDGPAQGVRFYVQVVRSVDARPRGSEGGGGSPPHGNSCAPGALLMSRGMKTRATAIALICH